MDPTTFLKLLRTEDRKPSLRTVALVGAPADRMKDDGVLHWTFLIGLGGPKHVVIDMPPAGVDGRMGVLILRSLDTTEHLNDITDTFESSPGPQLHGGTIQRILDLLLENGRNRYCYTDNGSGCRHWCEEVLSDLEKAEIVGTGSFVQFNNLMEQRHSEHPGRYPLPTRQDAFY